MSLYKNKPLLMTNRLKNYCKRQEGNKQLLKFQQTNFPDDGMIHRLHVPNFLMSVRYLIKRHSIIFDSMRILSLLVEDIPDIDS